MGYPWVDGNILYAAELNAAVSAYYAEPSGNKVIQISNANYNYINNSQVFMPNSGTIKFYVFVPIIVNGTIVASHYVPNMNFGTGDVIYSANGSNFNKIYVKAVNQTNRAYNATPTPSSTQPIDGNTSTYAAFTVSGDTLTEYYRIDLGAVYTIQRLSWYLNLYTGDYGSAAEIQTSTDGSTWTTQDSKSLAGSSIGDWSGNKDGPINARYIRIRASENAPGTGTLKIYEIVAWVND